VNRVAYLDDVVDQELAALDRQRGQYAHLTGRAAHEQFLKLCNGGRGEDDEFIDLEDVDTAVIARVRKEFPALALAAVEFEKTRKLPHYMPRFR
jgi:hypothetical protein